MVVSGLTVMYLYYNQREAVDYLESMNVKDWGVNWLFVDDGSSEPLTLDWAKVIRIDKDVDWNQPEANNIGLRSIKGTVLRMDMDHYFEREEIGWIQDRAKSLRNNTIVHFKRDGLRSHPNIYLANAIDIIEAGGYDEDFCGNYGYDDKELMHRLRKQGFTFIMSSIECKVNRLGRTKHLNRDVRHNLQLFKNKTAK